MIKQGIIVRTNFEAWHRYKDAPEEVVFLREWHRHIFYVEIMFEEKNSRELEFFIVKKKVDLYVSHTFRHKFLELSCEDIASDIQQKFNAKAVQVFEDNENGAYITRVE